MPRPIWNGNTLASKWNPAEFRDTYTDVLRRIIEAQGGGRVANLMKALQASLKDGGARKEPPRARP